MSLVDPAGGAQTSSAGTIRNGQDLTATEVAALCVKVAGSHNLAGAANAAAVIFAESGGRTAARCYNRYKPGTRIVVCGAPGPNPDGSGGGVLSIDRGLCQFNSVSHAELSDADCDDPKKAVQAMHAISQGFVDFHEWSSWNSGAYKRFLPIAQAAVGLVTQKGPGFIDSTLGKIGGVFVGGADAIAGATVSVGHFLALLADARTWKRVLLVVVGIVLVVVGAFLLDRELLAQVAGAAVTNAAGAAAAAAV